MHLCRPSPEPALPEDKSCNGFDFLCYNLLRATLAEVKAFYSATGEDLAASDKQFSLPTSGPCNHHKAMRDMDSERWRLGEMTSSHRSSTSTTSLQEGSERPHHRPQSPPCRTGFHTAAQRRVPRESAPVVKFTSIRVLFALAARNRLCVHQANLTTIPPWHTRGGSGHAHIGRH